MTTTLSNETKRAIKKRKKWGSGEVKRHIAFFTMLIPGLVFMFCFNYMPMPAIVMAFQNYKLMMPPADSFIQNPFIYTLINNDFVGFGNFSFLFTSRDTQIFLRNTICYNLAFMFIGLFFSVGLAIGVNELRQRFLAKLYHTILFLPYFLSWLIVTYLLYALICSNGVFNKIATALGRPTMNLYNQTSAWPLIFVIANIWRYTGNNSIIYLATITGFDQQLYEAAAIDGAGKFRQFQHITFPLLIPTIVLLQILAVGRIMNGDFDMFYCLPNGAGAIREATLTIDVYVYNALKSGAQLGYPAAAGLFQSVVGLIMVVTTNAIVRKVQPDMAMF